MLFALPGCRSDGNVTYIPAEEAEETVEGVSTDVSAQSGLDDEAECGDGSQQVDQEIPVYICGAVISPGVYMLPEGSLINDALTAAGGFGEDADKDYVNLAETIVSGEKIYIPTVDEVRSGQADVISGDGRNTGDPVSAAGSELSGGAAASHADGQGNASVNINTASKAELMTLSGVGEAKADAIIAYRDAEGPFKSCEDIMKVSGIGKSTYNTFSDSITVD